MRLVFGLTFAMYAHLCLEEMNNFSVYRGYICDFIELERLYKIPYENTWIFERDMFKQKLLKLKKL